MLHLTALAETRSLSTILLRRAAVISLRRHLGRPLHLDDTAMGGARFDAFLKGLRRTKGARPVRKAGLSHWRILPLDSGTQPIAAI